MASQVWPASLPDFVLVSGYEEQPPDLAVRTQMDKGPPKGRRRATAGVRPIRCRIEVDNSGVDTLDAFYDSTLKSGVLKFDHTHPRTRATEEFKFRGPPTYTPVGPNWFRVDLDLIVMP